MARTRTRGNRGLREARRATVRSNILITGASSGLGAGMAREFAARGRNLALCARRTDRLDTLREELTRRHPEITVVTRRLDVRDPDAVFTVFQAFDEALGGLNRVVVNAGLGKGQPVGTGGFEANRQTIETNVVGTLAQCEAAVEIFRRAGAGHLVAVSSMSALRGLPRHMTAYAASKAAVASLAEGIRADLMGTGVTVSTIFPGYIRSEMNDRVSRAPFMISTEKGCRLLARTIEREPANAYVPVWPWAAAAFALRHAPLPWVARWS